MQQLTIGDLGKRVGLPQKTIRFYEEVGLIAKPKRASNGYRVYALQAVDELALIKNARDIGLPIPEIKKLMTGCVDGNCEHTKAYLKSEVTEYLKVLDKKIQQLQELRDRLGALEKTIEKNPEDCDVYCCNILSQLMMKGGEEK